MIYNDTDTYARTRTVKSTACTFLSRSQENRVSQCLKTEGSRKVSGEEVGGWVDG